MIIVNSRKICGLTDEEAQSILDEQIRYSQQLTPVQVMEIMKPYRIAA